MEAFNNVLCCGCLCSGRKMKLLENFAKRQCFLQIINEIPMSICDTDPMLICWECDALINRFIGFKQQVKKCFKNLSEIAKQNLNISQIQSSSKLDTQKLINLYIGPNTDNKFEVTVEIVKQENVIKDETIPEIKEEDNVSTLSDNFDDDTVLIEYSNNKKKKKKIKERKSKKKKTEDTDVVKEVELSNEELVEERRLLLEREEYVIAMFRCEKCIITFPNVDDLNDHLKLKHDDSKSKLRCDVCQCTFATEVSYNYHTNRHTRRYQCMVCMERFNSKRAGTKHYEMKHCHGTDVDYQDNGMTRYENGHADLSLTQDFSESTKQDEVMFPCEFCAKTFRWKTSLRKHLETHRIEAGQKRKPYCEPCRISFTTTSNLQKHVKTSSKHQIQLKLWKLKESQPDASSSVDRHMRAEQIARSVNTARTQYPCAQCGRSFQWRGNLRRHVRSHRARANGELVCEPCNRTFSSIATYKQHMKISKKHVSESDFKYMCSDCGKRFANKTRLKDHVNWEHLKNFVHTCNTCQKIFKSHTSLYLHKQVVHKKNSAEHLCDHCGKHFPNRAKLRIHVVALHSGSAPFACARCPARFSWRSCLSRHSRRVHRQDAA